MVLMINDLAYNLTHVISSLEFLINNIKFQPQGEVF